MLLYPGRCTDVVRNALRILRTVLNAAAPPLLYLRSIVIIDRQHTLLCSWFPGYLSINVLGQVHVSEDAPPANASRSLTYSRKTWLRHFPGQEMLAAVICAASHRLETKVEAHKLYPPIPSRDGRRVLKSIDVVRNALRILRAAITPWR